MNVTQRIARPITFAAILALAGAIGTNPVRAGHADVYTAGHGDVNLSYDVDTNSLHLAYEFGSNAVINNIVLGVEGEAEADTITTKIGLNGLILSSAQLPAPFGGVPLWMLPQSSRAGRPFLGIGAEEIELGTFRGDTLSLTLTGISMKPAGGEFILWQGGSEATPFMNSADGLSSADQIQLEATGHDHFTWGFTKAGIYDLVFTGRGVLETGEELETTQTFRFQAGDRPLVVPEPGTVASMLMGLGLLGMILTRPRTIRSAEVGRA